MKNILWLASWYPNKLSPFDGDFLQRHAKAVSLFTQVHVIYVVKDDAGVFTKSHKEDITESGNLTEQIIYYNSPKTGIKLLDRILSQRTNNRLYRAAINSFIAKNGKPGLIHVQIAMKAGLAALWAKRTLDIPYIVSEQWTGYLPEADFRVTDYPAVYQKWMKKVIEDASIITVVTEHLGMAIKQLYPSVKYRVIPNVVDTTIFYPAQKQETNTPRFIHISNMNYQKNTEAILEAFHLLKNELPFQLHLYGSSNEKLNEMIRSLDLTSVVFLKGEVPQSELAIAIQQSDALILYSRFETFGCVLIEANACGVPVIVSDIEVFHELVEEGENGIFVQENNPVLLAEKLKAFSKQKDRFNKQVIAEKTAAKYNYKKIGQQFIDLYTELLA